MIEQFIVALLFYILVLVAYFTGSKVTHRVKPIIGTRWNISIMAITIMIYFIYGRNGP